MASPIHLVRRYNLYFKPLLSDVSMGVREVGGVHLGRLSTCDVCGSETFQEISRKE
ncbi:hypothetical protein EDB85DRAFT_1974656, partial [Lactarius pseudohatsudake]